MSKEQRDVKNVNKPTLTINKNAYELRTDILGMAKDWVQFEYEIKSRNGAYTASLKNGEFVATGPLVPTIQDVIKAATSFYEFVSHKNVGAGI